MAKLSHRFEYLFAKSAVSFVNLLSEKSAHSFGKSLGSLFHKLLAGRREIALDNLEQAFPNRYSVDEKEQIVKEVFQNIALTFTELAHFRNSHFKELLELFEPAGVANFQQAKIEGKGAVLVTSHFGSWELGAGWVVASGFELGVVARVQSNYLVDNLITSLRENVGLSVIHAKKSTLREIVKILKENKFVGFVADQHDASESLLMDFFGRKASVARGPAAFARKQNCPILPFMGLRLGVNRHRIIAGKPIYPEINLSEDTDVIRMTREYLDFFENVISDNPGQWMWTHRRWKV